MATSGVTEALERGEENGRRWPVPGCIYCRQKLTDVCLVNRRSIGAGQGGRVCAETKQRIAVGKRWRYQVGFSTLARQALPKVAPSAFLREETFLCADDLEKTFVFSGQGCFY